MGREKAVICSKPAKSPAFFSNDQEMSFDALLSFFS